MDRDCKDCVFSSPRPHNARMECDYPVPQWVKIHAGGYYVSGYEGKNCATYKSKADLVNEAKTKKSK
jgi:hypothetical protein